MAITNRTRLVGVRIWLCANTATISRLVIIVNTNKFGNILPNNIRLNFSGISRLMFNKNVTLFLNPVKVGCLFRCRRQMRNTEQWISIGMERKKEEEEENDEIE